MADDRKETKRIEQEQTATVKVEVIGPGSVVCAAGTIDPGKQALLTQSEFESVKSLVKKL
jgi:hypothetical protein